MSPVCFVTEVLSTLRSSAPRARKGYPQASALRLCSPPLRSALSTPASLHSKGGRSPSPCACYPRLRQEAFGMYVHAAARFKGKGQCNIQGGSTHEHYRRSH